jgi:hypothetical protein
MEPSWSIPIPQAMQQHAGLTSNKRTTGSSTEKPAIVQRDTAPTVESAPAPASEPAERT